MCGQLGPQNGPDIAVAEGLLVKFDGALPHAEVAAAVDAARTELQGQVADGCWDEMLHHLVAHRLRERIGAGD